MFCLSIKNNTFYFLFMFGDFLFLYNYTFDIFLPLVISLSCINVSPFLPCSSFLFSYSKEGGARDSAPSLQFLACRASTGPNGDSPQTFSVNEVSKRIIRLIAQKLGPWHQFENFNQLANLAES